MAEVQQLRGDYPLMDINVELWGFAWVFVARSRGGRDPWFLASDSIIRFRNALEGRGLRCGTLDPPGCPSARPAKGMRSRVRYLAATLEFVGDPLTAPAGPAPRLS